MANRLVPYIQDDEKWTKHYVQQAKKQVHPSDMTKCVRTKDKINPNLVLPSVQLIAQAESDMKREKLKDREEHAPIKATPEFVNPNTPQRCKRKESSSKSSSSSKSKKARKRSSRDAFD